MNGNEGASDRRINQAPRWPNARGWIAIGTFGISVMLLVMMYMNAGLREDEFFQTIATVIITNGLVVIVGWAFGASEAGEEKARKLAAPQKVQVVNKPDQPVPTEEHDDDHHLPEYAR